MIRSLSKKKGEKGNDDASHSHRWNHTGGVKISREKWQEHECVISHARRNLEEFSARLQTCAKRRIGIAIRDIYVGSKGHIGTYEHTRLHIYVRICTYIYIHLYTRPNNDTRGGEKWIHTCIHTHTHTRTKKRHTHDTPYTDGLLTYVFIARHSCLVG